MIHQVQVQVLALLLVAAVVGIAARRARIPYTLALVVAGLVLGLVDVGPVHELGLGKDLLLLLFLPALLFEATLHIDRRELRRELGPILLFAVPGMLVAVSATAALLWLGISATGLDPRLGWAEAALFAAIISATDPVSVLALFKELGVPRRLSLLVEGESLLNDGVAVVLFVIVGAVVGVGDAQPPRGAVEVASFGLRTFVWMAGVGTGVGLVVGAAASLLTRQVDDHLIEVTLTALVAYGSFLIAEQLHASGVLSTVAAGVVMGSYGREYGMSVSSRVAVDDFWEYLAFFANSFVFLLVGLQLDPLELLRNAPTVAVAFLAVLVARAITVYLLAPVAGRLAEPIPSTWRHVLVWGGLRGSLSMVLALSLPSSFEGRTLLVNLVFGVVACSLFLQGLSIGPLLARLGVSGTQVGRQGYEMARLRALAARDGLVALERQRGRLDERAFERLRAWYDARVKRADSESAAMAGDDVLDEQLVEGLQTLVDVERESVRCAAAAGLVSSASAAVLAAELDARREALEHALRGEDQRRVVLKNLLDSE